MATSAAESDSLHLLGLVQSLVLLRKTALSILPLFRMRNLAHVFLSQHIALSIHSMGIWITIYRMFYLSYHPFFLSG